MATRRLLGGGRCRLTPYYWRRRLSSSSSSSSSSASSSSASSSSASTRKTTTTPSPTTYAQALAARNEKVPSDAFDWQSSEYSKRLRAHDGGELVYTDVGGFGADAPFDQVNVLCIPQIGECRGEFRYMMKPLVRDGFRVLACELRGMGDSAPSSGFKDYTTDSVFHDLRSIMRDANLTQRVVVMASSTASDFAVRLARRHDLGVAGVVLISPFAYDSMWYRITQLTVQPWLRGRVGAKLLCRLFESLEAVHPPDAAAYTQMLQTQLVERGRMTAVRRLFAQHRRTWKRVISGDIRVPVHLVCGGEDPLHAMMLEQRHRFNRLIDTDSVWYKCNVAPSAGHYPHIEDTGTVLATLHELKQTLTTEHKKKLKS